MLRKKEIRGAKNNFPNRNPEKKSQISGTRFQINSNCEIAKRKCQVAKTKIQINLHIKIPKRAWFLFWNFLFVIYLDLGACYLGFLFGISQLEFIWNLVLVI